MADADDGWLVVGLGNPGPGYASHRHNVGQMVIGTLAERLGLRFKVHKSRSSVAEGRIAPGGARIVLAAPSSFMNTSGGPVAALVKFYKTPLDHVIVVHDELDIPFDEVRLKVGGGPGGHNGVKDIIAALGTPEFIRVRVGIGRPPGRQDPADFVLTFFSSAEKKVLPNLLSDAADAVEDVIRDGLVAAQQRHHSPKEL